MGERVFFGLLFYFTLKKTGEILEKVQHDKHINSVDIGRELGIDHKTVLNHLHKAGYKKKRCMCSSRVDLEKHVKPN